MVGLQGQSDVPDYQNFLAVFLPPTPLFRFPMLPTVHPTHAHTHMHTLLHAHAHRLAGNCCFCLSLIRVNFRTCTYSTTHMNTLAYAHAHKLARNCCFCLSLINANFALSGCMSGPRRVPQHILHGLSLNG